MTISANYPSIRPSLLLDFANTEALDPRITFSRPTTATYYDDNTSVIAEQNLFLQSQALATSPWSGGAITATNNSTTAPDGTSTATSLIPTATTAQHFIGQPITNGASTTTISVYAKPNGYNFLQINVYNTGNYANFDVSGGTVTQSNGLISSAITSVGSGWYRCSITLTTVVGNSVNMLFMPVTLGTVTSFPSETTNGTSGIYLWGAQLEQRSSATAYTATTTAAITNYIPTLQTAVANDARFDHNPTTRESLGLLIEEQRTNLVLYSNAFDNAYWTKSNVTITTAANIAPDGTQTAQLAVENTTSSVVHEVYRSITGTGNIFSFYAKAAGRNWVAVPASGVFTYFDIANGVLGTVASGKTATITSVGNGWYRCSLTVPDSTYGADIVLASANGTATYTGNGYSGIFLWGAQLEAGAFATSYIPTVASQVTRSADSASMTGTNFSSWYNISEGTVYVDSYTTATVRRFLFNINSATVTGNITLEATAANALNYYVFANGAYSVDATAQTYTLSGNKSIVVYKVNDFAFSSNGATPTTDTSGAVPPNLDRFIIGNSGGSSFFMNGTFKKIAYYPIRVTNAQLQGLTTV